MGAPLTPAERRRLANLLGRLGSDHAGERDNAAVMAHRLIQTKGMTWSEVIDPPPSEYQEPLIGKWRQVCAELQNRPGNLRAWEKKFVTDLPRFPRISSKQRYILAEIADRVLWQQRP
jgi:hypothetical protein